MAVMAHPKQNTNQFTVAELRAHLNRIKNVLPALEGMLNAVENAYGPKVEGFLAGFDRGWRGIKAARDGLQDLIDEIPAKGKK